MEKSDSSGPFRGKPVQNTVPPPGHCFYKNYRNTPKGISPFWVPCRLFPTSPAGSFPMSSLSGCRLSVCHSGSCNNWAAPKAGTGPGRMYGAFCPPGTESVILHQKQLMPMLLFVPTLYHAWKALVNSCSWFFHIAFTWLILPKIHESKPLHLLKMALHRRFAQLAPSRPLPVRSPCVTELLQNCYLVSRVMLVKFHNERPYVS